MRRFHTELDREGHRPIIIMTTDLLGYESSLPPQEFFILGPTETERLLEAALVALACHRQPRHPHRWYDTYLGERRDQARLVRRLIDAVIPPPTKQADSAA